MNLLDYQQIFIGSQLVQKKKMKNKKIQLLSSSC